MTTRFFLYGTYIPPTSWRRSRARRRRSRSKQDLDSSRIRPLPRRMTRPSLSASSRRDAWRPRIGSRIATHEDPRKHVHVDRLPS